MTHTNAYMRLEHYTGEFMHDGYRTWYRVTPGAQGLSDGKAPLILLHGGPGAGHDYLLPYAGLADSGRTIIHYDQVGCARSSHFPRRGAEFFTVDLFVDQLHALIEHLGLTEYHVLGHSWGGMLAVEHALQDGIGHGLRSLIIASAPASIPLWMHTARKLWGLQSPEQQEALHKADQTGDFTSPEFIAAKDEYYRLHLGDFSPKPECLAVSDAESENDGHTYDIMWGPYEFMATGSLHDWDRSSDAAGITVPTLILAGEHDQVDAETVKPFTDGIPDVEQCWIPNASHVPHLENPEPTLRAVSQFLSRND
ncbi:hypothetical protein CS006_02755 [Bifidobacterium primatium]|uniref:Proline iminopeptidase n=1 Tax=Bifidobacterium primatium TaxID=2045438 RepID=A0A2M9HB96_9BIFI|nr:hypothetical protein CS006_02755 [Bifidobacterium primatium]